MAETTNPKTTIMFHLPIPMKVAVDEAAEKRGVPSSAFIRQVLADAVNYKLLPTDMSRARKYATVEEREAARKEREKDRRDLIKQLLADFRAKQAAG